MVEFYTLFEDTYQKYQLQSDIDMLERDIVHRQRALGVELYDLFEQERRDARARIEQTLRENNGRMFENVTPEDLEGFYNVFQKAFRSIEDEIREPLESCRRDIGIMESLAVLPVLLQKRKEDFGVEIWPDVSRAPWNVSTSFERDDGYGYGDNEDIRWGSSGGTSTAPDGIGDRIGAVLARAVEGTRSSIRRAVGRLSPEECAAKACLEAAIDDVGVLEASKAQKFAEIERLVSGGTTLECCVGY